MSFYTPANFLPDNSIGYLVRRCHSLGLAAMEPVFARHGLSGMQWSALVAMLTNRASSCAELADEISYDRGATTRLVDSLTQSGWVTRQRDRGDRRMVRLDLTDAGADVARAVKADVIELWNGWLSDWDDDDVSDLITKLQRMRDTLAQVTAAEPAA